MACGNSKGTAGAWIYKVSEEESATFPPLIDEVLQENGWRRFNRDTHGQDDWNLWWKINRFRGDDYEQILPWQRINHYPRASYIAKKDHLIRSLKVSREVYGPGVYNFWPQTYILPTDYQKFTEDAEKQTEKSSEHYWIFKPTDRSRGRGIFIFEQPKELTYASSSIIQEYISKPLLISGYKFDLRLYVCVTSFHPLTIYIHEQGLVRFSTDRYDLANLDNRFAHLTNTSVNKQNPKFAQYVEGGTKWTLAHLRAHFHQTSTDDRLLWQRITSIVVLTLLSQVNTIKTMKNCVEVYGFDVLIDESLTPWLLEVNVSPQLVCDCIVDIEVKKKMIADVLQACQFQQHDQERGQYYIANTSVYAWRHKRHLVSRRYHSSPPVHRTQPQSPPQLSVQAIALPKIFHKLKANISQKDRPNLKHNLSSNNLKPDVEGKDSVIESKNSDEDADKKTRNADDSAAGNGDQGKRRKKKSFSNKEIKNSETLKENQNDNTEEKGQKKIDRSIPSPAAGRYEKHPCFGLPKMDRPPEVRPNTALTSLPPPSATSTRHPLNISSLSKSSKQPHNTHMSLKETLAQSRKQLKLMEEQNQRTTLAFSDEHGSGCSVMPASKLGGFSLVFPFNSATHMAAGSSPMQSRTCVLEVKNWLRESKKKIKSTTFTNTETAPINEGMLLWKPPIYADNFNYAPKEL